MTFYRLFPNITRSSRPVRKSFPSSSLEYTGRVSGEIATPAAPRVCPQCQGTLAVRGPVRLTEGGQLGLVFTCLRCEHQGALPEPRRPRVVRGELFDRLVESQRRGRRDVRGAFGGVFVSAVFQTGVVFAAVLATMGVTAQSAPAVDTLMLTLSEAVPDDTPEEPDAPPIVTSLAPPPLGFQVLEAPLDIPAGIPEIDLDQRFDPRDYSGRGAEGGVFAGVEGGQGPVDQQPVFDLTAVDELPEPIYAPLPKYPALLRRAGIEGYVDVRYIVLADGTVDPGSIDVVGSSNARFESAAVRAIRQARFRPGRVLGTPVRVLVEQRITFTLTS